MTRRSAPPRRSSATPTTRSREALDRLERDAPVDAWDGVKLRYLNPLTGGSPMPTMATFMQKLPAGLQRQGLAPDRRRRLQRGRRRRRSGHRTAAARAGASRSAPRDHFVVPSWHTARFVLAARAACCSVIPTARCTRHWASTTKKGCHELRFHPAAGGIGARASATRSASRCTASTASGRNYEEHAKEMGFTGREPPFFFLKPADAAVVGERRRDRHHRLSHASPRTCTTRSNWWWRSAPAARTSRRPTRRSTSTATRSAWT